MLILLVSRLEGHLMRKVTMGHLLVGFENLGSCEGQGASISIDYCILKWDAGADPKIDRRGE